MANLLKITGRYIARLQVVVCKQMKLAYIDPLSYINFTSSSTNVAIDAVKYDGSVYSNKLAIHVNTIKIDNYFKQLATTPRYVC